MKLRIQDNSVRFRITLKELDELNACGHVEVVTECYSPDGSTREGRFVYAVRALAEDSTSYCDLRPDAITLYLNAADRATLKDPAEEGVYLRRETLLPSGDVHRFMAFIEKDRPATRCGKPEAWIYAYAKEGLPASTQPIHES